MPDDIVSKLVDLSFALVPIAIFIVLFFVLEKRRKKH